ncbi:hypothetical protein FHS43_002209 [Streptosporangium becharense]|uniref:Uncharacterized protein n=1 Tax=Streptosporangium becharense TaxID=1816182 RepID=A0A7W9MIA2_9ACTN|nr:hypothetical protein [Streptosporangium becharense]MBB2910944.1 hypothetical protein [Streptosporangium becharense]MBB5821997.1 hypothetical protein [Streptosporangium becharense]
MDTPMDIARRVADTVLYEGYLLYPYRASAAKNRVRWQFGVLVPPAFTATAEHPANLTECLLEEAAGADVRLLLRFLHVRTRVVERAEDDGYWPVRELHAAGRTHLTFDEATEREVEAVVSITGLLDGGERVIEVLVPGDHAIEPIPGPSGEVLGRVVTGHLPLEAALRVSAERVPGPYGLVRLRIRVENTDPWEPRGAPREEALRRSLVAAHLLVSVSAGAFVSLLDPPEWARPAAETCRNEHTWPVLVGEPGHRDVMLSSPIILYDHPDIAPESPGALFDATEIDELLHLRTLTLTEEETREARATDSRAAGIIDMVGELPPEMVERLHGVIRYLNAPGRSGAAPAPEPPAEPEPLPGDPRRTPSSRASGRESSPWDPEQTPVTPWWDPGSDPTVSPGTDSVTIRGMTVARGSRVRLVPGRRRADAHDMFLAGRTARVEAVLLDLDGARHLAVTLEEDPGADLYRSHGRFLYFAPDEVEPLDAGWADEEVGA